MGKKKSTGKMDKKCPFLIIHVEPSNCPSYLEQGHCILKDDYKLLKWLKP